MVANISMIQGLVIYIIDLRLTYIEAICITVILNQGYK
jgi:hypothetical protein